MSTTLFSRIPVHLAIGAVIVTSLSGCSLIPLNFANFPGAMPTGSASPAAVPAPVALPIALKNDLATGTAQHDLADSGVTFSARYWSTLGMDRWVAAADKPLTFCLSGSLTADPHRSVYLSRLSVVTSVDGTTGALPAPAVLSDTASVSPGYLITAPYSYTEVLTLPPLPAKARSVTLAISYEILVTTGPRSTTFAKQTVTDQLTIALAGSAPASAATAQAKK